MRTLLLFAGLSLLAVDAHARCDSGERAIRLGLASQPSTLSRGRAVASLASTINRDMQGRACLKILSNDQQFSSSQSVAALLDGSIDFALPSFADLGRIARDYKIFELPFAFRDNRAVGRFLILAGDRMQEPLKRFNVKSLAVFYGHFDQIASRQTSILPEDLAGLKMTAGNHSFSAKMISTLKAVDLSLAQDKPADTTKATAMATAAKTADAQAIDWFALSNKNASKPFGAVTQTNHRYHGHVLLVSQSWWNGLSSRLKRPLEELIARISRQANFDAEQQQANARRNVIADGVKVHGLTRRQRQLWIERLSPVWDEFENKNLLDIVRQADRAL
ncbi:MAG: TRAP transporter substrate-binding protein DctP [Rhizobiaceae bacterium]